MTPESDHDLLLRIDTRLDELRHQVTTFNSESAKDRRHLWDMKSDKTETDDHEKRIRAAERMLYIGIGGLFMIQIILALIQFFWKLK